MPPEPLAQEALAALFEVHGLSGGARPVFRRIATGKHNTSYYVDCGRQHYVLRIAPPDGTCLLFYERRMMAQEPEIHRLLRAKTAVPVAEVLLYDDSRRLLDRDYMIMERLPGRPLTELDLSPATEARVLRQVGQALAAVHALTADRYGYLGAHRPMAPQEDWATAFTVMWGALLDDIVAVGCYSREEADALRGLLARHRPALAHAVPASLLHMDIWHQNILADDSGRLTGLLDWDRALWGDPEIEFAVLDYCGVSEPPFWEGYGRERDTSPPAQVRRLFYLLYELQKYIVIEAGRRRNRAAAQRYKEEAIRLALQLL